jgi:MoaA/NifB/PqqE/SkfB family radical SAM enzyme
MDRSLFDSILARLPKQRLQVSLQGEGEPFIHPSIWEFVEAVVQHGHVPYTITNGTIVPYPERVAKYFPFIGLSLDTLDASLAERIGRGKVELAIRGLKRLLEHMDPARIIVHTVDFGQPLAELRTYVRELGCRHRIQPLQQKDDYRQHYANVIAAPNNLKAAQCEYVASRRMRYFNIDGIEMPCAFIKDARHYAGLEWIREQFAANVVPACCNGCRELQQGINRRTVIQRTQSTRLPR